MPRDIRPPFLARDRKTGIWGVHWFDRRTKQTRRRSLETKDQGDAERRFAAFLLDKREDDAAAGTGPLTVGAALDLYYQEHVLGCRRDGSPKVIDRPREEVTIRNLKLFFAGKPVQAICDDLVGEYGRRRSSGVLGYAQGRRSAPKAVKDATVRRELQILLAALRHNLDGGRLSVVPTFDIGEAPEPRFRVLTPAEWSRLLDVAAERRRYLLDGHNVVDDRIPRLYRFLMIGLHAAARRRCIEGLMWTQVDRQARVIDFNPPGARQSSKRRPIVPIGDKLWPVLERAFAEKTSLYVLDHPGDLYMSFMAAVERAGLSGTGIVCHTLRHTYATWALAAGVPIWKVAGMLGDTIKTVEKNYAHHHPDYLREAANFGDTLRAESTSN